MSAYISTDGIFCGGQSGSVVEQPREKSITEVTIKPGQQKDVVVENQIKIYPNPNNGNFTIQTSFEGESRFVVTSLTGQRVYGPVGFNGNIQVQLNSLSKGIYLCRIQNKQGVQVRKIEAN